MYQVFVFSNHSSILPLPLLFTLFLYCFIPSSSSAAFPSSSFSITSSSPSCCGSLCYSYVTLNTSLTWSEAQLLASSFGNNSKLAEITTADNQIFLFDNVLPPGPSGNSLPEAWISGTTSGSVSGWFGEDGGTICDGSSSSFCFWKGQLSKAGPSPPSSPGIGGKCRKLDRFGLWISEDCTNSLSAFVLQFDFPSGVGSTCSSSRLESQSSQLCCQGSSASSPSCFFQIQTRFGISRTAAKHYARFAYSYLTPGNTGDLAEVLGLDQHLALIQEFRSSDSWINIRWNSLTSVWERPSDSSIVQCSDFCLWEDSDHTIDPVPTLANSCVYMNDLTGDWKQRDCETTRPSFIIEVPNSPGSLPTCQSVGLPTSGSSNNVFQSSACSGPSTFQLRRFSWMISKTTAIEALNLEFPVARLATFEDRQDYLSFNVQVTNFLEANSLPLSQYGGPHWIGGERKTTGSDYSFGWRTSPGLLSPFFTSVGGLKTCVGDLCELTDIGNLDLNSQDCLVQQTGGWTAISCFGEGAKGYIARVKKTTGLGLCSIIYSPSVATTSCCDSSLSTTDGCFEKVDLVWPIDGELAHTLASGNGKALATIRNVEEAYFVYRNFNSDKIWIGASLASPTVAQWQELGTNFLPLPLVCGNNSYCVPSRFTQDLAGTNSSGCVYLGSDGLWYLRPCSDSYHPNWWSSIRSALIQPFLGPSNHNICKVNNYLSSSLSNCESKTSQCCDGWCYCSFTSSRPLPQEMAKAISSLMKPGGGETARLAEMRNGNSNFLLATEVPETRYRTHWIAGSDEKQEGMWTWENGDTLYQASSSICANDTWCTWAPTSGQLDTSRNCLTLNSNQLWQDRDCYTSYITAFLIQFPVITGNGNESCLSNFYLSQTTPICCSGTCFALRQLPSSIPHIFSEFAAKTESFSGIFGALAVTTTPKDYLTLISATKKEPLSDLYRYWIGGKWLSTSGFSWTDDSSDLFYDSSFQECLPGKVCPFGVGQPRILGSGADCLYFEGLTIGVVGEVGQEVISCGLVSALQRGYLVSWKGLGASLDLTCPGYPVLSSSNCCDSSLVTSAGSPLCSPCTTTCFNLYQSPVEVPWFLASLFAQEDTSILSEFRNFNSGKLLDFMGSQFPPFQNVWIGGKSDLGAFYWSSDLTLPPQLVSELVTSEGGPWLTVIKGSDINTTGLFSSSGRGVSYYLTQSSPCPSISSTPSPSGTSTTSSSPSVSLSSSISLSSSSTVSSSPSSSAGSSVPSSSSNPRKPEVSTPTLTPLSLPKPTRSKAADPGVIECTTSASCDEQKENPPCSDISNPECEEKILKCKKEPYSPNCRPEEDVLVVKPPRKGKQTYYVSSKDGTVLGAVTVDPSMFPPGFTIHIRYVPGTENSDFSKDTSDGCSSSNSLLSLGSVVVDAYDKEGRQIKKLEGYGITVTFFIPKADGSRDVCVFYTDNSEDTWQCDEEQKTKSKKDKGDKVSAVDQKFDHLTSFAVFILANAGCGSWWILALCFIGGIPLLLSCLIFILSRFRFGKKLLFGYTGKSLKHTIRRVTRAQSMQINNYVHVPTQV